MSDLSDERVRETAERLIQSLDEQGECDATDDEVEFLAREVLALRERVAAMERERDVWRAKATHYDEAAGRDRARLLSEVATLTRQRDEAVAVAREAVAQAEALAGDGCHLDQALAALRARLAALQEGTDAHS